MRFQKIKVTDKGVQLIWTTIDASGTTTTSDCNSPEKPAPDLPDALASFVPFVMELLDLPATWRDGLRITSLSINEEKETKTRGLIVTAVRKVAKASGRLLVLNTPHMREAGEESNATSGVLEDATLELIAIAERAATAFVKGERMQGELIPTDASASPATGSGESDIERAKKKRGKKNAGFIPGQGDVANPDKDQAPTDALLRSLLLQVGRDVPQDALERFASIDRDAAQRWAEQVLEHRAGTRKAEPDAEPELLLKYATPALIEEVAP